MSAEIVNFPDGKKTTAKGPGLRGSELESLVGSIRVLLAGMDYESRDALCRNVLKLWGESDQRKRAMSQAPKL